MNHKMSALSKLYIALIIVFLYAPIVVMIIFSFNASVSTSVLGGFSTRWYISLLHDTNTMVKPEATPGAESGRIILRSTEKRLAPRSCAASIRP